MKFSARFDTLGDTITIEEREIDALGCFDARSGVITIDPREPYFGKIITLIHESMHVAEEATSKSIDHEYITATAFGIAVILAEAGLLVGISKENVKSYIAELMEDDPTTEPPNDESSKD